MIKKISFKKRVAKVSPFWFTFKKLWGCNLLISKETRQLVSVCTKNFWLDSTQAHTLMKTTAESWSSIKQGPLFTIFMGTLHSLGPRTTPSTFPHCEPFCFNFLERLAVDSWMPLFFWIFLLICVLSCVLEALYLFSLWYLSFLARSF